MHNRANETISFPPHKKKPHSGSRCQMSHDTIFEHVTSKDKEWRNDGQTALAQYSKKAPPVYGVLKSHYLTASEKEAFQETEGGERVPA